MGQSCCKESKEKSKPSLLENAANSKYDVSNDESVLLEHAQQSATHTNYGGVTPTSRANETTTSNGNTPEGTSGTADAGNAAATEAQLAQQQQKTQAEAERERALREESARLEAIVSNAGRDMVPLGGGGGIAGGEAIGGGMAFGGGGGGPSGGMMAYFDPSYAASVSQDLLYQGAGGGFAASLHGAYRAMDRPAKAAAGDAGCASALADLVLGRNAVPPTCIDNAVAAVEVLGQSVDFTRSLNEAIRYDDYLAANAHDGIEDLEDVAEHFLASLLCTKEGLFQDLGPIVENLP